MYAEYVESVTLNGLLLASEGWDLWVDVEDLPAKAVCGSVRWFANQWWDKFVTSYRNWTYGRLVSVNCGCFLLIEDTERGLLCRDELSSRGMVVMDQEENESKSLSLWEARERQELVKLEAVSKVLNAQSSPMEGVDTTPAEPPRENPQADQVRQMEGLEEGLSPNPEIAPVGATSPTAIVDEENLAT